MADPNGRRSWGHAIDQGVIARRKQKPSLQHPAEIGGVAAKAYESSQPGLPIAATPRSLLCASALILNIVLNLTWVLTAREGLKDLGSFLHSGAAYRHGVNPYAYESWLLPQPISREALNLNPPISVYVFDFLSRLPTSFVERLFLVGSALMLALALGALLWAYRDKRNLLVVLAVVSFAGVWHMLWYLQLYAPLVLAVVCSWLLMRRGNLVWAGILLGLVAAVKPNFGIVILALLLARHFKVGVPALGTAAALSAIPLVVSGPTIYWQWLELTTNFQGVHWTSNASVVSVGARLHAPIIGYMLAAIVLSGVFYLQWRYRPTVLDSTGIALTAAVLIGPVSWAGYTLFLLPFLFSRTWDRAMWTVVLLLCIPFAPKQLAALIGVHLFQLAPANSANLVIHAIFGSVYVWAVLLLMHRLLVRKPSNTPAKELPPPSPQTTVLSPGQAPLAPVVSSSRIP